MYVTPLSRGSAECIDPNCMRNGYRGQIIPRHALSQWCSPWGLTVGSHLLTRRYLNRLLHVLNVPKLDENFEKVEPFEVYFLHCEVKSINDV